MPSPSDLDKLIYLIIQLCREARDYIISNTIRIASLLLALAAILIFLGWPVIRIGPPRLTDGLFSLGINLINSSLIFFVIDVFLPQARRNRVDLEKGISFEAFAKRMKLAKREIRVLTTYFGPFTSMPEHEGVRALARDAIREAIENNKDNDDFRIKILMLKPESEAALLRENDLKFVRGGEPEPVRPLIRETIFQFLEEYQADRTRKYFDKIEVKLYDNIPPFFLLQCDNAISVVHYLPGVTAPKGLRLELTDGSAHAQPYTRAFSYFWEHCNGENIIDRIEHLYINIKAFDLYEPERVYSVAFVGEDCKEHGYKIYTIYLLERHVKVAKKIRDRFLSAKRPPKEQGAEVKPKVELLLSHRGGPFETYSVVDSASAIGDPDDPLMERGFEKYGTHFDYAFVLVPSGKEHHFP
jgi:hypothetical protein